jgi:hypothetical protein
MNEPKRESYLPDSVHGSQRHLSALAKNELVLVSEYGCPHVFLTPTCNPEWPEIQSQLINGQTAFDCPDVTVPVFTSRLDKFKTNIRNGKYFKSREVIYIIHGQCRCLRDYHYNCLKAMRNTIERNRMKMRCAQCRRLILAFWIRKGLTKCPVNGFIGSLFSDGFFIIFI